MRMRISFPFLDTILHVTAGHMHQNWDSYLFIGSPASGHKHYVETSKTSNRDEEQACNTHYGQPKSTGGQGMTWERRIDKKLRARRENLQIS